MIQRHQQVPLSVTRATKLSPSPGHSFVENGTRATKPRSSKVIHLSIRSPTSTTPLDLPRNLSSYSSVLNIRRLPAEHNQSSICHRSSSWPQNRMQSVNTVEPTRCHRSVSQEGTNTRLSKRISESEYDRSSDSTRNNKTKRNISRRLSVLLSVLVILFLGAAIAGIIAGVLLGQKTTTTVTTTEITTTETTTTSTTTTTGSISLISGTNETIYGIWNTTVSGSSSSATSGTSPGNYYSGQTPANAFDLNTATKYMSFGACTFGGSTTAACGENTGFYFTPLRGSSMVVSLRICTGNDLPPRDPVTVTLEGSNQPSSALTQGLSWTLIYNGSSGLDIDPGRWTYGITQNISNSIWYQSYRLLVMSKRGVESGAQYAEVELTGY